MPAATTMASASRELLAVTKQAMDAGHADVGHQVGIAAQRRGRHHRFLGHRQVAGARRHDHDLSVATRPPPCEPAARKCGRRDLAPPAGKHAGQMLRLLVIDPRRQAILTRLDQLADDALDPRGGLALAENDLGKAAASRRCRSTWAKPRSATAALSTRCRAASTLKRPAWTCSKTSRRSFFSM